MALPTWHCLECEKDFKAGDWQCTPGQQHLVASKRYYMADAPTVVQLDENRQPYIDKKSARTLVLNIPPEKKVQDGDEFLRVPGGSVEFVRGLYETNDPEIQFHLDRKQGLCTYERWKEVYWTDAEKLNEQKMEIAAAQHRLQSERNELLEKVKSMEVKPERKKPGPKPKVHEPIEATV